MTGIEHARCDSDGKRIIDGEIVLKMPKSFFPDGKYEIDVETKNEGTKKERIRLSFSDARIVDELDAAEMFVGYKIRVEAKKSETVDGELKKHMKRVGGFERWDALRVLAYDTNVDGQVLTRTHKKLDN